MCSIDNSSDNDNNNDNEMTPMMITIVITVTKKIMILTERIKSCYKNRIFSFLNIEFSRY